MAAPTSAFARWLARVDKRNAGGEFYLTDVVALAVAGRRRGRNARTPASVLETLGVNSQRDLATVERLLPARAGATRCSTPA